MALGYCLYLRKSRADMEAESRGEGETLARHEKILLDLAKRMKLHITQIYREIVSGETISLRPVIQQLLSEVEQGTWSGVLVVEVERLARGDTIDQGIVAQSFKYSNTKIITPMKVYDPSNEFDEEYFEFGLFMSRREYKTINRRLQRGRLESIKEGKYLGTTPPYGYIRKRLIHDKGFSLEVVPEQASVVQLIFELYAKGDMQSDGTLVPVGVSRIAKKLNELNIKPLRSQVWVASTIRGMLRNPVYIGKIRWNSRPEVKKVVDGKMTKTRPRAQQSDWILVEGLHAAIINEDVYDLVQKRLSHNKNTPLPNGNTIKNPLSSLMICGICGRKMVRRPYNNGYPDALICSEPTCNNISSRLAYVEEKLIDALRRWLDMYTLKLESTDRITVHSNLQLDIMKQSITSLDQELKSLEKQSDNLHNLLERGIYSTDLFLERSKILTERIQVTTKNRDSLMKLLNKNNVLDTYKKRLMCKSEKVLEVYHALSTPTEKNRMLQEVLEKVVYIKTVNGRWHGSPDDFELSLFPKLPSNIT